MPSSNLNEELQYVEQRRVKYRRHLSGAKRKPLIGRLVTTRGKGLLLGIAIVASVWRTSKFLHRHPSPVVSLSQTLFVEEDSRSSRRRQVR